jgi:5-methyltetrahydropteroyltriglutamate--homocysteine methyltransferase
LRCKAGRTARWLALRKGREAVGPRWRDRAALAAPRFAARQQPGRAAGRGRHRRRAGRPQSRYGSARRAGRAAALPAYPTTTIGSFPQTAQDPPGPQRVQGRQARCRRLQGRDAAEIGAQRARAGSAGLDVLVHGEAERNDMVEYSANSWTAIAFSQFGWVQSWLALRQAAHPVRRHQPPASHDGGVDQPAQSLTQTDEGHAPAR